MFPARNTSEKLLPAEKNKMATKLYTQCEHFPGFLKELSIPCCEGNTFCDCLNLFRNKNFFVKFIYRVNIVLLCCLSVLFLIGI